MISRNITLTLEKAKEWYNSGSEDLKEVALQAYKKEELEISEWQNIKTFEDACKALGIQGRYIYLQPENKERYPYYTHIEALNKVDIIRKALNKNWKPSLIQGRIYYPYVRFYFTEERAKVIVSKNNNWKLGESFISKGKKYTLVGGDYDYYSDRGLTNYGNRGEHGVIHPSLGLLGCESKEIAMHMSYYFSKEIFEAIYAHYIDSYIWVS